MKRKVGKRSFKQYTLYSARAGFEPVFVIVIIAAMIIFGSAGYLYLKKIGNKQINLLAVTPTPSPQFPPQADQPLAENAPSSTIDIFGWKTYRNEKYGFEVKYPVNIGVYVDINTSTGMKDVATDGTYEELSEIKAEAPFLAVYLYQHNPNFPYADGEVRYDESIYRNSESITIAGIKTNLEFWSDAAAPLKHYASVNFTKDDFTFSIALEKIPNKNEVIYENVFDQILSTFKFVEQNRSN